MHTKTKIVRIYTEKCFKKKVDKKLDISVIVIDLGCKTSD